MVISIKSCQLNISINHIVPTLQFYNLSCQYISSSIYTGNFYKYVFFCLDDIETDLSVLVKFQKNYILYDSLIDKK